MGGIDIGSAGAGRRRSLDSEINMIPMIDLLMVTISFLLITAVWTHMARINSDAQVPGPDVESGPAAEKQLHIEMRGKDRFLLAWKQGSTTIDSTEVPRNDVVTRQGPVEMVRFPELADKIESEWRARGQHASTADHRLDQAVLHTDNETEFKNIVGVIDAVYQTHREMAVGPKVEKLPAFNVTFAVN
jgi:biopolymer transport protein ExbD